MNTIDNTEDLFGPAIHTYTRAQAIHHRLIRSLARGRLWACGLLGAMPREAHRGEIQRETA